MKIMITKDNKLIKDDQEIEISKINSDFLEEIINSGLKKELEITIEGDTEQPLAVLFKDIQDMLKEDSEFYKEMHKYDEKEEETENLSTDECIQTIVENKE